MANIFETAKPFPYGKYRFMLAGFRSNKGQTLVEYSLLLVLIAVVVVLMVKGVGLTANNTYSKVNSAVKEAMQ